MTIYEKLPALLTTSIYKNLRRKTQTVEEQEYHTIYELEESHWWYLGLHALVKDALARNGGKTTSNAASPTHHNTKGSLLDAGCGAGKLLKDLSTSYDPAIGVDISPTGVLLCKKRGLDKLITGSVSELPFKDESFEAAISLDVIYHMQVPDDRVALKELQRVLTPGGILLLNLPAFDFLSGSHDRQVHTKRRYTTKVLKRKLLSSGFEIEELTYRNAFLFPVIFLVRTIQKLTGRAEHGTGKSDVTGLPKPVNRLLTYLLLLENRLLAKISLPFGSSVFCVARKPRS